MQPRMSASGKPDGLLALPDDILIDHVFLHLENIDLARLRLVNKALKKAADDELLWKRKTNADYNFPTHATARLTGFRELYKGLTRPRVFVWGESSNCRLGIAPSDMKPGIADLVRNTNGSPFPLLLDYTRAGPLDVIGSPVEIIAAGWSFHVLTSKGEVLVWGTLDGSVYSQSTDLADPHVRVKHPQVLKRSSPHPVTSISSGRAHAVALTSKQEVLEWYDWSCAPRHEPLLTPDNQHPSHIEQLEAGWDFTVALVHTTEDASIGKSGRTTSRVEYWNNDWMQDEAHRIRRERSDDAESRVYHAVRKVSLPPLPPPSQTAWEEMRDEDEEAGPGQNVSDRHQLITRIGAGDQFVVALTASGLVYRLLIDLPWQPLNQPNNAQPDVHQAELLRRMFESESGTRTWELMEDFCLPSRIAALPAFQDDDQRRRLISPNLRITHLDAHFGHFVTYSPTAGSSSSPSENEGISQSNTGIVLIGTQNEREKTPEVKKELQGIGVIKMSLGDWHWGALTASGKVLTWGSWSNGALGIWDSLPLVEEDTEQREGRDDPFDRISIPRGPFTNRRGRIGLPGRHLHGRGGANLIRSGASGPVDQSGNHVTEGDNRQPQPLQPGPSSGNTTEAEAEEEWNRRLRPRRLPWPREIQTPTEVVFDPAARRANAGRDSNYVFDIAFAGWQSAAIAIDTRVFSQSSDDSVSEPRNDSSFHSLQNANAPVYRSRVAKGVTTSSTRSRLSSSSTAPLTSFDADAEILHRIQMRRRAQRIYYGSILFLILGCVSLSGYLPRSMEDEEEDGPGISFLSSSSFWPALITFWPLIVPLGLYAVIARWSGERLWRFS